MDEHDLPDPDSAERRDAKEAYFGGLDVRIATSGGAGLAAPVPPPPVPAPSPALSFEAWAEMSIRFAASPEELVAALRVRGLTLEAWNRLDAAYSRAISDDLRAGRQELSNLYHATWKALARATGEPAAPTAVAERTPPRMPVVQSAPEALRGTFRLPDLPDALLASMGRVPFVPPPPIVAAPAQGKPPAKTVPSRVVPSRVGGKTMPLDIAQQRPTPTLPFVGSSHGVGYLPSLNVRQYVTLCTELVLHVASPAETWARYFVPTEAAFRLLDAQWQHPARRAELEVAFDELVAELRRRVLR